MKKMFLVLLAGTLAIGFSAFTPEKPAQTYYYQTSTGFATFTGSPCDPGTINDCWRTQPGVGSVLVLKSQNANDPLKYN